ncbi:MAG TPA: DUF6715 family protein [Lachnospiraceae bacterium]|nr:DUF6715 family protein [Lachnospiraceae bacterium]
MAKRKKVQISKTLVVIVLSAILIVAYIYMTNNRDTNTKGSNKVSDEVQSILDKDIEATYPDSPREVVKLNSRINVCYYKESLSDDNLKAIMSQQRLLFDEELLSDNKMEDQLANLKVEIEEYKKINRSIISYVVNKSSTVKTWTSGGKDYASIVASYSLKDNDGVSKTYETFLLRKDKDDKWKIVGWKLDAPSKVEE